MFAAYIIDQFNAQPDGIQAKTSCYYIIPML